MITWLKATGWATLAALAPIKPVLIAALALVLIDFVSGLGAARARKERITSAGLRRTVSKGLVYTLAILAAHVAGVYLLGGLVPVVSLVAGAIGLVEARSVFENLNTMAGGSLFSKVISSLGSANDTKKE